jgi:hypothetical protein
MVRQRWITLLIGLVLAAVLAQPAAAANTAWDAKCHKDNGEARAPVLPPILREMPAEVAPGGEGTKGTKGAKGTKGSKAARPPAAAQAPELSLTVDPQFANKVVNLGSDRNPEEVTLRVNATPEIPVAYAKHLVVVAEPFVNASETGDTNSFEEPTFSRLYISTNRKRITFKMCIRPTPEVPAGKYISTVMVEGPPPTEAAVFTVTVNGKDGGGFWLVASLTALLAFCVLFYKGAAEKRALSIAGAQSKPEGTERERAIAAGERWWPALKGCFFDLGWWVPTIAALAGAFALLWAAYAANPAWGEGGVVTSGIALVGTGLAAVGAKAVFSPTATTN